MKKIQKLQVTLNEVKRMQQLAGIEPLNELSAGLRNRAAIKARDRGGKDNMIGQSKSESIFEIPKKYQDIAYKIAESISTYFTDLVFTSPKGIKDCKVNIVNPYLIKDATASKDVYIDLSFYSTDVYNNTAEKKYKLKETFALYRMYMRNKFFGLSSKIEESTSDSFSEYIAKCKLNGTDKMPSNSNGESVSGIDNEIKSLLNKLKSELGAKINEASNNKHVWEGWTVQDFIDELEPTFDSIMKGNSYMKPPKNDKELKDWLMDNQPYYKKHIPDVFKYFKNKMSSKINEGNLSWKEMDRYAKSISNLTGTDSNAVKNFIEDNDLDAKKLYSYAKSGKSEDRMNFATALVGNPGNKYEKMIITKFGLKESINEGTITVKTKDGKLHHYPNFKKDDVISFLTKNKMKQVNSPNELKSNMDFYIVESVNESKFKKDDLVYNTKTKTVGIVRIGDDKYGEVKTDADGNVNVDDLEKYNPIKNKHQKDAKASPSTKKEVNSRGLFNPFKNESVNEAKVNKKYTHFIVNKKTNKILNGFDYKGLDNSSIQDYFMEDLKDMDLNKRDVSLSTAKSLMSKNIDPFDKSNWSN